MIVLANRSSASASEIVTGALQDHDRAYIVGETTFGKALVQSVYRISNGAGLALTTAHYYTPSGRLIQRPWDETFDEYLTYTLRAQDDAAAAPARRAEAHRCGTPGVQRRRHRAGSALDGPIDGFKPTEFGRLLYSRQEFATFAQSASETGDTRIEQTPTGRMFVSRGFEVDRRHGAGVPESARREGLKIDDASFTTDLPFIKAEMRYEIDQRAVRHGGGQAPPGVGGSAVPARA